MPRSDERADRDAEDRVRDESRALKIKKVERPKRADA